MKKFITGSAMAMFFAVIFVQNGFAAEDFKLDQVATNVQTSAEKEVPKKSFTDSPPTVEELKPLLEKYFEENASDFCFANDRESQEARGVFMSFGKSVEVSISSIDILRVGAYKGYWPIEMACNLACTLCYRSDFAQHSNYFAKYRGEELHSKLAGKMRIKVTQDDFGSLQVYQ
jgi:hypothetical protein